MSRTYPRHTPLGTLMGEEGWTVKEVADITGIHQRTMTDYLAGRKTILDHHLVALSDLFEVSADDLLDRQVQ